MKSSNTPSILLRTFSNLHCIGQHMGVEAEHSDKIILPKSIFFIIRNTHYPVPPVFILRSSKVPSKYVYCGVLEFTAEENSLYCPNWILRKVAKRQKYSSAEVRLEILQTAHNKSYIFPLLTKLELITDHEIDTDSCKKALTLYTVITKGDNLTILNKTGIIIRASITNILPRNRCLIKSTNFDLTIVQKLVQTTLTEEDDRDRNPLIDLFQISLLSKSRMLDKRKQETATPWEHRVRPIKLEGDCINLLPWESSFSPFGEENLVAEEFQFPEINANKAKPVKKKKILSLAFPQISHLDMRPLTTINKDLKHKSISYSPISRC